MTAADRARSKFTPPIRTRPAEATTDEQDLAEREALAERHAGPKTARTDPIRKTVDLSPARYKALRRWLDDAADELGVTRVTSQDALNGLVHLLVTDDNTSRRVIARLKTWQDEK